MTTRRTTTRRTTRTKTRTMVWAAKAATASSDALQARAIATGGAAMASVRRVGALVVEDLALGAHLLHAFFHLMAHKRHHRPANQQEK